MRKFFLAVILAVVFLFASPTPKADALPIYYTGACQGDVAPVYKLQNVGPGFTWVVVGWVGCSN